MLDRHVRTTNWQRTSRIRPVIAALPAVIALIVAGCSGLPSLTTGSVAKPAAALPKPSTPIDRALHVAATSARAQKCGYFFDPAKMRTNFIAAETVRGATPDVLAKLTQSYDFTVKRVSASIKDSSSFCSKDKTAGIKTSLQRALAGDFEPPVKKKTEVAGGGGLFGDFEAPLEKKVFNPGHVYDPLLEEDAEKAASDE